MLYFQYYIIKIGNVKNIYFIRLCIYVIKELLAYNQYMEFFASVRNLSYLVNSFALVSLFSSFLMHVCLFFNNQQHGNISIAFLTK